MPIVIRPYREEDWPQVAAVWSLSFFGGEPIGREHRVMRHRNAAVHVAEDEEGIVGVANLLPREVACRDGWLATGGLAAVAVAPEHRLQGVGSSLMHWMSGEMRRRGMTLSMLHALRPSFYREFGYAHAGRRVELTCPVHKLPRLHEDMPIQRLTLEDWPELEGAYRAFAARYSGMMRREGLENSLCWLLDKGTPVIYAVGRPVEAYIVLHLNPKAGEPQKIAEMVWATPRGWRALMGVLSMLCINASCVSWCEPPDGPYLARHGERVTGIGGWLPPMYRVLNVPNALEQLKPEGEGSFTLSVDDDQLLENIGPWRVTYGEGRVVVEPVKEEPADLSMGIGPFTQALLGEPSLAALVQAGAVSVRDGEAYADACRLLPPRAAYCLDFF